MAPDIYALECRHLFFKDISQNTRAQFLKEKGVVGLSHITSITNIISILKTGSIFPIAKVEKLPPIVDIDGQELTYNKTVSGYTEVSQSVFTMGLPKTSLNKEIPFSFNVIILISPHVLNRRDYFVNPSAFDYGHFSPGRSKKPDDLLHMPTPPVELYSEYVFGNAIPIEFFEKIIIAPQYRERFEALLIANNIELGAMKDRITFSTSFPEQNDTKRTLFPNFCTDCLSPHPLEQ